MNKSLESYSKQPLGKFLSNIGRSLFTAAGTRLSHLDIKRNFYALILIEEGQGAINQQDLADLLNSDKVSVVRITDYLTGRGYIKRVRDNIDKRKYRLTLTEKAEKELPLIRKTIDEVAQKALKGLSDDKIEAFYKTLNVIKNNMNLKNPDL
jgi:MarR family transcriptional regulator, transcriptional regulator for hemolysin